MRFGETGPRDFLLWGYSFVVRDMTTDDNVLGLDIHNIVVIETECGEVRKKEGVRQTRRHCPSH